MKTTLKLVKNGKERRLVLSCAITLLFWFAQGVAAERTLVVDPLERGDYPVGSTNFTINDAALSLLLSQGGDAGQLQQGSNEDGQLRYIDELLAFPDDAFVFQLLVPNNAMLYGESAGSVLPYAGYIFYPTTTENNRPDYDVFIPPSLPRMQGENELPIFADPDEKYPLIVYSHGAGDHPTGDQLNFLIDLASHGYIVLALYHGDNRFAVTEGRRFALRPLAINKAIDKILADPAFSDNIDHERIGGTGGSFGGATMLALMGAKTVSVDPISIFLNNPIQTVDDSRIKAAATIVPYAGAGLYSFFGAGGIGAVPVDRPFMANSSNTDEIAEYSKIQDVINSISGVKYLVEYDGEGHGMSDGAHSDAYTWIKIFLDAFIKQDASAIEILAQMKSVSGSGVDSLVQVTEPAPVVAIEGGNRTIADTDGIAGESVSFTGTATDSDGTIATTQWLVDGSEVATGLTATIALPNGSTVVTFKATDNDGVSSTTTATITVATPTYTVTDEWPSPYNGVTPDSSLGLAFNNIGIYDAAGSTIYTCLRVFTDGLPGSVDGIGEFDIGFTVVSLDEGTVQVTKFREFNVIGALNENVELPDCSGKFETTTGVFTDTIETKLYPNFLGNLLPIVKTFETTFNLIDPDNLILKLSSYQELTAD